MNSYEVIVGNIGCVYHGDSLRMARRCFSEYMRKSKAGYGRAGGESVTLMRDGEPIKEHIGEVDRRNDAEN